jgi:hypothetical protein
VVLRRAVDQWAGDELYLTRVGFLETQFELVDADGVVRACDGQAPPLSIEDQPENGTGQLERFAQERPAANIPDAQLLATGHRQAAAVPAEGQFGNRLTGGQLVLGLQPRQAQNQAPAPGSSQRQQVAPGRPGGRGDPFVVVRQRHLLFRGDIPEGPAVGGCRKGQ